MVETEIDATPEEKPMFGSEFDEPPEKNPMKIGDGTSLERSSFTI